MFTIELNTTTPAFKRHGEIEVASALRHIADQIEAGRSASPVIIDSNGERIGSWRIELPPVEPALVGEELVCAYIAYVDTLWANPIMRKRLIQAYARDLPHVLPIRDDASQRAAVIEDTDMVHPSNWIMRLGFIAHLKGKGLYGEETALQFHPDTVFAAS